MRQYRKQPFVTFTHCASLLGHTTDDQYNDLCKRLGYTADVWKGWKREGKIPYVVGIAMTAMTKAAKPISSMVIIKVPNQHYETITNVVKACGGTVERILE